MPVLRVLAAQKKSANHGAHASGLPQKSRNEFCGKRRRRRKRKQLEQTQAVSKCALRRRGGVVPSKSEPNSALISSIVAVFEPSL